jgi:probable HAF family extracellular repeat protein
MHDIGPDWGDSLLRSADAINSQGQIAGWAQPEIDTNPAAILYEPDGSVIRLDLSHPSDSYGIALNDSGDVVGYIGGSASFIIHPFYYHNGVLTDLGTFGGNSGGAWGINDAGQVVGYANRNPIVRDLPHAFLWQAGVMKDLGTLGGSFSEALSINQAGQIVGDSFYDPASPQEHAFLWTTSGGMVDLNSLINPRLGWTLTQAWDINDKDQIVGNGVLNGENRAFLLTPSVTAPEPSTLALAGGPFGVFGILGALARARTAARGPAGRDGRE